MGTIVEEEIDLEESLRNDGHYRSTHRVCAKAIQRGEIIEANCGEVFRVNGVVLPRVGRCSACVERDWWRPCPVCGDLLV